MKKQLSEVERSPIMAESLRQLGYRVTPPPTPPTPQRKTQVLSEAYERRSSSSNAWLPGKMRNDTSLTMHRLVDRRIPFDQAAGCSPEEVLDACCSMMVVDRLLTPAQRARMLDTDEV